MDFTRKNKILITCANGITPYLEEEVKALGFPISNAVRLGVFTRGSLEDTISLNLQLRTGIRVHYLIEEFKARTPDDFYFHLVKIPWEHIIDASGYVSVSSSVSNVNITDTRFANLKCKDAIVDRIKEKKGRRPDSGPNRSRSAVFLYWNNEDCAIYIDTSGEPLAKRGYRKIPFKAPMQETLAAAVLKAAGWRGDGHFINPMCGSGTLCIEAALMALNKAPGLLRNNFAFMHVLGYSADVYQQVRQKLRATIKKDSDFRFILTDHDPEAISSAKQNARTAGVDHLFEFKTCDFRETPVPDGSGVIVVNPGYGIRLEDAKTLEPVYAGLGNFFKQQCQGYRGYIFTGNMALAKKVGLKTSRRLIFYNGSIEARLLEYELYHGSLPKPRELHA